MNGWGDLIARALEDKQGRDIVILGKGPSVDLIDTELFRDFIVINVNDTEVIYPGDLAVFHHGWVLDVLERHGPRCRLYVTDRIVAGASRIDAPYVPYTPDTADFLLSRFFSEELHIEHAIVISALKIANELGRLAGKRKRVFLLGFDFTTKDGWSRLAAITLGQSEPELVERAVSAQEELLQYILNERARLFIDVIHVGSKSYSFYSPEAFNDLLRTKSGKLDVSSRSEPGQQYKVKVVAEITTNHFGDMDRLESMILAARRAGADYIKLQKRDVESFYSAEELDKPYTSPFGATFRDYRQGLELSKEEFEWVDAFCKRIGIGWFASVLDYPSYLFMRELGVNMLKLPSTISEHREFLNAVGQEFFGDLVISTGFTDEEYEAFITNAFSKARKLYLLQCTSAYPSSKEDAQIGVVRHYYNLSKHDQRIVPGFSSHDIGSLCSQMAVAAGALMIEKHVKYGSVSWAHFDEVAVDLVDGSFSAFVDDVRLAERIVGQERKTVKAAEHHKYWKKGK